MADVLRALGKPQHQIIVSRSAVSGIKPSDLLQQFCTEHPRPSHIQE